MDMIIGGLAFFAIVAAHLCAVVALRDTRDDRSIDPDSGRGEGSVRDFWRMA
jgi:hypothetical protein